MAITVLQEERIFKIDTESSSYVLGVLLEKNLIHEAGRKEALGRPILYATSEGFLRHFGLSSLEELPPLPQET